jgi:hypothetical protein
MRAEAGFGVIEVLVATLVLAVGILGMLRAFTGSQKLELVSERSTTMAHMAQREIERLEGIPYAQLGLSSAPMPSTDPKNPDYYVTGGSSPTFEWNRSTGASEPLDVDNVNGTVAPTQSFSQGMLSGTVYDFISWAGDPNCSPGCASTSNDYKRLTVAVTLNGEPSPGPVWVSSVIANPDATPQGGVVNGTAGNPITSPASVCTNSAGQQVTCVAPIDSGNPNTFYLHDCPATNSSCPAPSSNSVTHQTVGIASGLTCTGSQLQATTAGETAGCPIPDLMDSNPPAGDPTTTLYQYSTDLGTTGYPPGGRIVQPLCAGSSGCGTGQPSDCSNNTTFAATLTPPQNEFWVSPPLSSSTTLTGDGGMSLYTQTQNGASAVISFCIEIYDVPPSGSPGSLADLLAWPPVGLGGAGYVAATDPSTGSNWPAAAGQLGFTFNFHSGGVTIPAGDRIGVRVWIQATANVSIALLYDDYAYPTEIQLNTQ